MAKCIYCDNDLDDSSEHVLQESLGGSWESKNILCKECNRLFGETIDKKIAEDFKLFRSFLNVLGKRDRVPDCPLETGDGKKVVRDHETGFLKDLVKPDVQKIEGPDGKIACTISGTPGQAANILKGIIDKAEKRGDKIGVIRLEEYIATPAPPCHNERALNPETWIAALKSIVNFCALSDDGIKRKVIPIAKKIHEFAHGCRESKDKETPSRLLIEFELGGYPLGIKLSGNARDILSNGQTLYHGIFLVPQNGGLYGGLCLFNNIFWGFKISDDATGIDHPISCVFDPQSKRHLKNLPDFNGLDMGEFVFSQYDDIGWLKYNQEKFNDSLMLCKIEDLRTTILSYLDNKDILQIIPYVQSEDVEQIVIGRIKSLMNLIWSEAGLAPEYSTLLLESSAKDFFDSFIKQNESHALTADNYPLLMNGVINFSIETLDIWKKLPEAFS